MSEQGIGDDGVKNVSKHGPTTPVKEMPRSMCNGAADEKQTFARQFVAAEMDSEIVVCNLKPFQKHYLPFVAEGQQVKTCIEYLQKQEILEFDELDLLRWTAFRRKPSEHGGREDDAFKGLITIGKAIARYQFNEAPPVRHSRFTFKQQLNKATSSEVNGSNHQIDGFFTSSDNLRASAEQISTSDIAVPAEFKKIRNGSNVLDNRQKLVGAANHIMNNDPRRMFTYGITIEDATMTLWYFSRSHSAKSKSFNFVKDVKTFVSIFMSFIFATEQEMGYDPMIHQCFENDSIVYVYEIKEGDQYRKYFKATESLSEHRSMCISGRMTRVWKATEVVSIDNLNPLSDSDVPVVLKDLWLDRGALTERDIQSAIFSDIEKFKDTLGTEDPHFYGFDARMEEKIRSCLTDQVYKKYFLQIICDDQGYVSRCVEPSAQAQSGIFVFEDSKSRMSSHSIHEGVMESRTHSDPTRRHSGITTQTFQTTTRPFVPKQQYRVVFKEVCRPLHHIQKLSDVIGVVRQCFVALQLLYCAGWVHRDISSGNLLSYGSDGALSGKLADLEYAKRFLSEKSSRDPKTGTPYFMPYEIQTQLCLFLPTLQYLPESQKFYDIVEPGGNSPLQPLRYNFQHDVESFWWLILWFITARVDHFESQQFARDVFQNTLKPSDAKTTVFRESGIHELNNILHESLRPFSIHLITLQTVLLDHYLNRAKDHELESIASYSIIYKYMSKMLSAIHNLCDRSLELVIPPQVVPLVSDTSKKRTRLANDDDDEYRPSEADESSQLDRGPPLKKRLNKNRK